MSNQNTNMSGKSSSDSEKRTEHTAHSLEHPSEESSKKSITPENPSSLIKLQSESGNLREIKNLAEQSLVDAAEDASGAELSQSSRQVIRAFIDQHSRGFAGATPMICRGTKCPFLHVCPIYASGSQLPLNKRCPVEHALTEIWVNKHLKALGIEISDLDSPENSFDLDMLYELAGQELLRWRCGAHLSENPRLYEDRQVGSTPQGEPIFAEVISPAVEIMESLGKNVHKLRDALLATRKSQVAAGQMNTDPTQKMANIAGKAKELSRTRLSAYKENIKDADYEVKKDEE